MATDQHGEPNAPISESWVTAHCCWQLVDETVGRSLVDVLHVLAFGT